MEIKLYGNDPSKIQIAKKCSIRPAGCYLNEFLKYVQMGTDRWQGSTSAGTDLNPNVEDIVAQLKAQRYDTSLQNWYRLYQSGFMPRAVPPFSEGYNKIVNRIQTMRADAATRGVDISLELTDIRWLIIKIVSGRDEDNANWLIKGVNRIISNAGKTWTVATTETKGLYGDKFLRVNFQKTLENHADISSDLKSKLATFITDFGSEDSADGASLTHYNALQASRIYQDVLLSDKTCQVAVLERWG